MNDLLKLMKDAIVIEKTLESVRQLNNPSQGSKNLLINLERVMNGCSEFKIDLIEYHCFDALEESLEYLLHERLRDIQRNLHKRFKD